MAVVLTLAGIFGALIGSFLNVVIHRLPRHMPMGMERSQCPRCGVQIAWYDNVPVLSYLVLLGRCRACRVPISIRYPSVELITALLFAACAERTLALHWEPALVAFLVTTTTCAVLVAAAFIDWDTGAMPAAFTLRLLPVVGIVGALAVPAMHGARLFGADLAGAIKPGLASLLVGIVGAGVGVAATAAVRLLAARLLGRAVLAGGDVKLMGALGLLLGPLGVLAALGGGFLGGSLVRIAVVTVGRRRAVPLGPFLAAACIAVLLLRPIVLGWVWPG
jgi:leader peptidase (prepilin peptidase)/N-methyltransferase